MQERTLPPSPPQKKNKTTKNNKKPKTHNKTKKINKDQSIQNTRHLYRVKSPPPTWHLVFSHWEMNNGYGANYQRGTDFFFVINVWYSVRFLAEFITLSILRDIFFSSSFYSRYHIEIRTYFYIIYMHNCFHNRGGVFNFQIIRDRIVIAWVFFKILYILQSFI